jgi:hypothetical protein
MPFPEIERFKKAEPKLAALLSRLETYLEQLLTRPAIITADGGRPPIDITTAAVAQQLEIDEGLALVLLGRFDEAGVLTTRYDAFCPRLNKHIATYGNVNELPDVINCTLEDETTHTIHEYFIELVFMLSPSSVEKHGHVGV